MKPSAGFCNRTLLEPMNDEVLSTAGVSRPFPQKMGPGGPSMMRQELKRGEAALSANTDSLPDQGRIQRKNHKRLAFICPIQSWGSSFWILPQFGSDGKASWQLSCTGPFCCAVAASGCRTQAPRRRIQKVEAPILDSNTPRRFRVWSPEVVEPLRGMDLLHGATQGNSGVHEKSLLHRTHKQ